MLRANPMFSRMSAMFDEMKKMKGVPLATTTTMAMGPMHVENSSEATEVKTSAIPASTFEVPKDFTEGRLADVEDVEALAIIDRSRPATRSA